MSYLRAWVNSDGRQPPEMGPVTHLENDFASGRRFVELLHREKAMDSSAYEAALDPSLHPLEVFEMVEAQMEALGCSGYKPSQIGRAATGQRGGAPALLLAIKEALEVRAAGPLKPKGPSAIASVRAPKEGSNWKFKRPPLTQWGADDFLEQTYKAYPDAFDPEKGNPFAPIDMAVHLAPFHKQQRLQEQQQLAKERQASAGALALRSEKYGASQMHAREAAALARDHLDQGDADWRANQRTKVEREKSQLRYELSLEQAASIRADVTRVRHANAGLAGVDAFERNLKRLGLGNDGGAGGEASGKKILSTASESGLVYLQRIEEVASSAFLSPEEEGELVGKVYGKARAHRTARLERERRRRKLAVDQEVAKEIAEVEHAAQVDWANIQSAAKQSREDARVAWEQAKLRTAALATRADVTANLHAMQQAGARESIEQLSLAARERYEGLSAERNKANARLDLANQLKRKQRHALNTEMIEDVVASLVFLATATADAKRDLGRPLVLSDWLKLRKGFVNDTLRPPPFPPLPALSEEISAALVCEARALTKLSGGWSLDPLPAAIAAADARNQAALEQHAAVQEAAVAEAKKRYIADVRKKKKQAEVEARAWNESSVAAGSEEEALAAAGTADGAALGDESALAVVETPGEDQMDGLKKVKDEVAPMAEGDVESLDLAGFVPPAPSPLPTPAQPLNGPLLFPNVAVEAASVVNQLLAALDAQGSVSDPSAVPLNLRPKLLDGPEGSSSFGDALSSLRVCFVADPLVAAASARRTATPAVRVAATQLETSDQVGPEAEEAAKQAMAAAIEAGASEEEAAQAGDEVRSEVMSSAIEAALEAQDHNDHLDAAATSALALGPAAAREQARTVPAPNALNQVARNAATQLGLAWSCPSEALDACAKEAASPTTQSTEMNADAPNPGQQPQGQLSANAADNSKRTPAQSAALLEVGQQVLLLREAAAAAATAEKEKDGKLGDATTANWKAAGDEQASDALIALAIKAHLFSQGADTAPRAPACTTQSPAVRKHLSAGEPAVAPSAAAMPLASAPASGDAARAEGSSSPSSSSPPLQEQQRRGWIVSGFPATANQAALWEHALSQKPKPALNPNGTEVEAGEDEEEEEDNEDDEKLALTAQLMEALGQAPPSNDPKAKEKADKEKAAKAAAKEKERAAAAKSGGSGGDGGDEDEQKGVAVRALPDPGPRVPLPQLDALFWCRGSLEGSEEHPQVATEGDSFSAVVTGATGAVRGITQLKTRVSSARAARKQAKLDAEAAAEAAANEPPSKKGKGKAGASTKQNKSKPSTPASDASSGGKDKQKGVAGTEQEQSEDDDDAAATVAAETAARLLLSAATEAAETTEWWIERFSHVGAPTGSLLLAPSGACVQGWAALQEAAVDAPLGGLIAKKAEAPLACRFAAGVEFVELACEAAAKRKQAWSEAAVARCVQVAKAQASYAAAVEAAQAAAVSEGEAESPPSHEITKPLLLSAPRYALYEEQPSPSNEAATAAVAAAIATEEEKAAAATATEESSEADSGASGAPSPQANTSAPPPQKDESASGGSLLLPPGAVCAALRERRKNLSGGSAASQWQSIRCDGASVALPGGTKALRFAHKMYRETMETCDLRMANVALRFMELEGSIAELAPRLRWAAAVAVRAHDRGQTAQLVANARDQLSPPDGGRRMGNMPTSGGGGSVAMASASRNSNTANSRRTMSASSAAIAAATEHAQAVEMKQRTLLMSTGLAGTMAREKVIDDLESQLGDVAVERYKTAQQGLEQLKSEAFAWAARVGDEADQAAAEVAAVELQRLCAAETMMNDYFAPQGIHGILLNLPPRPADGWQSSAAAAATAATGNTGNRTTNSNDDDASTKKPAVGVISPDAFLANSALALRRDLAEASYMPRGTSTATGASIASASPLFAFETMLRSFVPLPPAPPSAGAGTTDIAAANGEAEIVAPSLMDSELEARLKVEAEGIKEDGAAISAQKQDALAVMRVRACETLRAAIAKATRLRAAAEAAAIEATSDGSTEVKNNQSQKWNGTTTAVASSNGNDNDGSDSNGNGDGAPVAEKPYSGPSLSRIIECRTQAEHRAIAVACSNLRASVDLPPVAAAGPALLPSFGGGGGGGGNASSVVTSRASFSGGGSQASSNRGGGGGVGLSGRLGDASMRSGRVGSEYGSPRDSSTMVPALWVALDSLVGQGGPWSGLQTPLSSPYLQGRAGTSDYDGVNVMDPNQAGNFTGALSMEQALVLVEALANSARRLSISTMSNGDDWLPLDSVESVFAEVFSNYNNKKEAANNNSPEKASTQDTAVWSHKMLPRVLSTDFCAAPWAPPLLAGPASLEVVELTSPQKLAYATSAIALESGEAAAAADITVTLVSTTSNNKAKKKKKSKSGDNAVALSNGNNEGSGAADTTAPLTPLFPPVSLPWRLLSHHLACALVARSGSSDSLPSAAALVQMALAFQPTVTVAGGDAAVTASAVTRESDGVTATGLPEVHASGAPAADAEGEMKQEADGRSSGAVAPVVARIGRVQATRSDVLAANFWFDQPPLSSATASVSQSEAPAVAMLPQNIRRSLKELYATTFQQSTGVRLVAVDSLLFAMCHSPAPPLASGYSEGLFKACAVAAAWYPYMEAPAAVSSAPSSASEVLAAGKNLEGAHGGAVSDDTGAVAAPSNTENTQGQEALATTETNEGPEESAEKVSKANSNSANSEGGGGKAKASTSDSATESPLDGRGLLLSRRALDLLLIACPPPSFPPSGGGERMETAVSAATFLDSQPSDVSQNAAASSSTTSATTVPPADPSLSSPPLLVPRPCISFADFAAWPEVQRWVKLGWFRLRDLGATLDKMQATSV